MTNNVQQNDTRKLALFKVTISTFVAVTKISL